MKKGFLRIAAGVMTLMMLLTCVGSGMPTFAAEKQEKVLTVTQDMVNGKGMLTVSGEWDRVIVPKEIEAANIFFRDVKVGVVEIESGANRKVEMVSGEVGEVAVVPAKLKEMTIQDLCDLIKETGDSVAALKLYQEVKGQNGKYLNQRPTVVTGKDVTVENVNVSGNAKLDLKKGNVENVKVDADGTQSELNVDISNYNGNVSVKQEESKDGKWMIARVKLKNSSVENLVMEGEGTGSIVLDGQKSEVKEVKVESSASITLDVSAEKVEVTETAENAKVTVWGKVEEMQISAEGTRVEVGSCGTVTNATVEGNGVTISGDGKVSDVEITSSGAAVSTPGTNVEGVNTYVPPVVVGPSNEGAVSDKGLSYEELGDGTLRITGMSYGDWDNVVIPAEIDGKAVTEIGRSAFYNTEISKVVLPDGLLVIDELAFYDCPKLTEVVIPDSVEMIGRSAFADTGLTNATIPKNVRQLGSTVFGGCAISYFDVAEENEYFESVNGVVYSEDGTMLVAVPELIDVERFVIPEGTVSIGEEAFRGCSKIKTIVLPASLESVEDYGVGLNECLIAFEVASDNPYFTAVDGVLFSKDMKTLLIMPEAKTGSYTVPTGVEKIEEGAFASSRLTEVIIPEGVTEVGLAAFIYSENLTTVSLPESLEILRPQAFNYCSKLKNIKLPSNLKVLGGYAFQETAITTLTIPVGITLVDTGIFNGCIYLSELVIPENAEIEGVFRACPNIKLKVVEGSPADSYARRYNIPVTYMESTGGAEKPPVAETDCFTYTEKEDGTIVITGLIDSLQGKIIDAVEIPAQIDGKPVTEIGKKAFWTSNVKKFILPEGLLVINDEAFAWWRILGNEIEIPESVQVIGRHAFYSASIAELEIPKNVREIGVGAFAGCSLLESIDVAEENKYFTSVDGALYSKDKTTLYAVSPTVETDCYKVAEETKVILEDAFYYCSWIESVEIPANVEYIGVNTFNMSERIRRINVSEDNPYFASYGGVLFDKKMKTLLYVPEHGGCDIPEGVEEIGERAYYLNSLYEVEIPEGAKTIGVGAFYSCFNLTTVTLPDSLERIYGQAFSNCSSLDNIILPPNLGEINGYVFANCSSLTQLTIPESVTMVDLTAFDGCTGLTEVVIPESVEWMINVPTNCPLVTFKVVEGSYADNYLQEKNLPVTYMGETEEEPEDNEELPVLDVQYLLYDEKADGTIMITEFVYNGDEVGDVRLPAQIDGKDVTEIRSCAFCQTYGLGRIVIPDTVQVIGEMAFYRSTLTTVTIPKSVREIGEQAFTDCETLQFDVAEDSEYFTTVNGALYSKDKTVLYTVPASLETECYDIAEGTKVILRDAFTGCNAIEEITIPASVENIAVGAIEMCERLSRINVSEDNPYYTSYYGVLYDKDMKVLLRVPEHGGWDIPEGVEEIGENAYAYSSMEEIVIPEGVKTIGKYAFGWCFDLNTVTLPDSLERIYGSAFLRCWALENINLPLNLKEINGGVFSECESLTHLTIPDSVTKVDLSAFNRCTSLTEVVIPESVEWMINVPTNCPLVTFKVVEGSYADNYLQENNLPVTYMGE